MQQKFVGKNVALSKTEKEVIKIMLEKSNISILEIAEKIGVSKRTIERAVKKLKENEIITRVGSSVSGTWIVIK